MARDPTRAARGRRQLQGGQAVRRPRQGARPRPGRPQEPDARPAGREDRPRGAHVADGRWQLQLAMSSKSPTVILLAGLQGSGKTTAAAKLALLLRKEGSAPRSSRPTCSGPPPCSSSSSAARSRFPCSPGRTGPCGHRRHRAGEGPGPRCRDRRHRRPSPDRRAAHGGARRRPSGREAAQRAARPRLHDGPRPSPSPRRSASGSRSTGSC